MSLNSFIILIIISIFSFVACCQVKNVAILCCLRLFTTTNRNKDSNDYSPSSILHAQTRCRSVHTRGFTAGQNKLWKIRTGLPGRQAVAGRGPRAAGPSGRRAAGPWRAVGRGPLGRGPAFSKTHAVVVSPPNNFFFFPCLYNFLYSTARNY